MTENEELYETLMRELDEVVVCDSGEIQQQHEVFLFNEETVSDDFPPSLLSYFETSKNRAAVCEKLIIEDLEGFTASHQTDDVLIFSTERDKDKLNMQVSCETEKEEINTSSKTEKLFIHNVSTSVNSEDEADIDECVGCEENVKGDDVKMKKNSEYQRNVREKRRCEETEKEEKRRRREREFEEELKKLMEAEKQHQEELELMEKKAQEKLEQEFLLQQELISNLQRRVEEEKKMRDEEEERRRKEEEERRKQEEERRRKEEERKKQEEERRRRKEEERRKQEEERRRKEEERKKQEEERRRKEEERKKQQEVEEEKQKEDEEKKRMKEEKKKQKEEGEKKREEEEQKRKEEEEKQERRMKEEEEKRKEEKKMKEEREKKQEEERKREEEEKMERKQMEEEVKRKKDDEVKREKEGMRLKEKQKQQEEEEKKEEEETRQTDEEEEMMEVTKRKNEGGTRRKAESNSDEEVKMKENDEEEKMMKRKEEINIKEDEEKEKKIKEEETRKLEEEEMRRQKKEEEEIRVKKEKRLDEDEGKIQEEKDDVKRRNMDEEENIRIKTEEETNVNRFTTLQQGDGATVRSESTSNSFISPQSDHHHHLHPHLHHRQDPESKTTNRPDEEVRPRLPLCLPENTEHKRLTWMKLCTSWSKLSLQNKNKAKTRGGGGGGGGRRKVDTLPPLCPNSLLQSTGCKSLQEVTSLTLEDSSSCNLTTLAQCFRLQSLTLRRCGLKSLDNINELQRLCYIDVQENSISSVDCENMKSLRVLRLGHNELRSIHGLNGAEHLDFLDVSHNIITRVAGLESMRRLQTLTVDHNQLISTRGLKDVYTLMHLDCSHNHLVNVEGLENNALLKTLDLRANNLTEPPSLSNHVLLTDLRLDNNSVSSLQGLSSCWLPLMQRLSAAQNRITHLPSMFDFVSLENLDLQFNCLSELQDVCQSLDGCLFLRQLHLVGNPLQQEKGWRSALQKAASGLRLIDSEETDSSPSSAAVQRVNSASGGFITFCQTQLAQTDDLQQQHSDELRKASSRLDEVKICCRHFNETLKLAIDHRFAHEYGEVTVSEGQTTTPDDDDSDPVKTFLTPDFHFFETTPESNLHNRESTKKASSHLDEVKFSVDHENNDVATSEGQTTPSSNHQNLESIKTTAAAAVLIQQQWKKYRVKCLGNVSRSPPTEEEGGGETESGPSFINRSHVGQDQAATVIQALWRGFALRRRLASALAAVTSHDDEDETLEEVDVDEFIFDEEELERYCSLQLYDDSPSRRRSVKPLVEPSEHTLPPVHPQEAWPDPPRYKTSTHTFNGRGSPSSASDLSDVSTRTKQIMDEWGFTDSHTALQLLRRAEKMKPKMKKQPGQKHTNPCVRTDVFRNCSYQRKPAKAPNYSGYKKAVERSRSLRHDETQPMKPRLDDDDSESERFLPEISSDIQNGGRVQLVADPGYTEQLHHSGGSLAKTLAAQTCNQRHRNTRNDLLPSPQRVSSAPNRKERISFRDNAVRFSGGWGGGKKRSNDK